MKKKVKMFTAICIVVLATTTAFSVNSGKANYLTSNKQNFRPAPVPVLNTCTNYTWYRDEEMTDPAGTVSDINVEIGRLMQLFSGYSFSSADGMGLLPFEWGYRQNLPPVVIYSNLY